MNKERARQVGEAIKQLRFKLRLLKSNLAPYDEQKRVAKGIVYAFNEYNKAKGNKKKIKVSVEALLR
jgi:hypothetical protein